MPTAALSPPLYNSASPLLYLFRNPPNNKIEISRAKIENTKKYLQEDLLLNKG